MELGFFKYNKPKEIQKEKNIPEMIIPPLDRRDKQLDDILDYSDIKRKNIKVAGMDDDGGFKKRSVLNEENYKSENEDFGFSLDTEK